MPKKVWWYLGFFFDLYLKFDEHVLPGNTAILIHKVPFLSVRRLIHQAGYIRRGNLYISLRRWKPAAAATLFWECYLSKKHACHLGNAVNLSLMPVCYSGLCAACQKSILLALPDVYSFISKLSNLDLGTLSLVSARLATLSLGRC